MRPLLTYAFIIYQLAGGAAAAVIIAKQPLNVALGALGVGLPVLLVRWAFRKIRAKYRVARRLAY